MKKETLTVDFVDFWPNLKKTDNYFYHLLSQEFDVVITDKEPDILFHSVDYPNEKNHLRYNNGKTKKIFLLEKINLQILISHILHLLLKTLMM